MGSDTFRGSQWKKTPCIKETFQKQPVSNLFPNDCLQPLDASRQFHGKLVSCYTFSSQTWTDEDWWTHGLKAQHPTIKSFLPEQLSGLLCSCSSLEIIFHLGLMHLQVIAQDLNISKHWEATLTTVTGCLNMEAVWRIGGTRFAVWVLFALSTSSLSPWWRIINST